MLANVLHRIEEVQGHWQLSLLASAVLLCWAISRERPSPCAFAFLAAFTTSIALFNLFVIFPPSEQVMRFTTMYVAVNWQLVIYLAIAVWLAIRHEPLEAKLLAGAVGIAELLGVLLSSYCNFVSEDSRTMAQIEAKVAAGASDYACGRAASHFFEFLPVLVELMIMALIVYIFLPRRAA